MAEGGRGEGGGEERGGEGAGRGKDERERERERERGKGGRERLWLNCLSSILYYFIFYCNTFSGHDHLCSDLI